MRQSHLIPQQSQRQSHDSPQGEERETAPHGPALALLGVLGVAAPRAQVDQQDDQRRDQPGSGDGGLED